MTPAKDRVRDTTRRMFPHICGDVRDLVWTHTSARVWDRVVERMNDFRVQDHITEAVR